MTGDDRAGSFARREEASTPAIDEIFAAFPEWVQRFWIDGRAFGGEQDHRQDRRVLALDARFPLAGRRILELGPLEGAHAALLEQLGADEVVSIEGRAENYAKCCVIRGLLGLERTRFVFGDLRSFDFSRLGTFDACLCLGVLYHLTDPALLLRRIAAITSRVLIWTHWADESYPEGAITTLESGGASYRGKLYDEVLTESRAGLQQSSFWPLEEDLQRMIEDAGFVTTERLFRAGLIGGGKCGTIYASKA